LLPYVGQVPSVGPAGAAAGAAGGPAGACGAAAGALATAAPRVRSKVIRDSCPESAGSAVGPAGISAARSMNARTAADSAGDRLFGADGGIESIRSSSRRRSWPCHALRNAPPASAGARSMPPRSGPWQLAHFSK
jgi:hypothetical protein